MPYCASQLKAPAAHFACLLKNVPEAKYAQFNYERIMLAEDGVRAKQAEALRLALIRHLPL
jgi:hypothetical protein